MKPELVRPQGERAMCSWGRDSKCTGHADRIETHRDCNVEGTMCIVPPLIQGNAILECQNVES